MKTVPHPTLPLATTSPFTPPGRSVRHDPQSWNQAFVGAGKFSAPGAEAQAPAIADVPPRPSGGAPPKSAVMPVVPHVPAASWQPAARASALPFPASPVVGGEAIGGPDLRHETPAAACATHGRAAPQVHEEMEDAVETPLAAKQGLQRSADARTQPPIRVHVEHQGGGVAVWLGVDRSIASECLQSVVAALRSPARAGPAVVSLTCNGAAVFSRSPNHKDIP